MKRETLPHPEHNDNELLEAQIDRPAIDKLCFELGNATARQ
jgi:hypothetical protein